MKKFVSVALTLCLVLFAGNAYSQQTRKQNKVKDQKEVKVQKSERGKVMEKEMERAQKGEKEMGKQRYKAIEGQNDPQGNAYGRNKGGLEGKEFGQARAADAKAMKRARVKRERAHKRAMIKRGR